MSDEGRGTTVGPVAGLHQRSVITATLVTASLVTAYKEAALNVSQLSSLPDSNPVVNQRTR
jgi:hypothetical protein